MDNETALSLVIGDYEESEWECIEDSVDNGHYKHDTTNYYSVLKRLLDNTYWMVHFTVSSSYGLDEDSFYIQQVIKKEVVKTEWVMPDEKD